MVKTDNRQYRKIVQIIILFNILLSLLCITDLSFG